MLNLWIFFYGAVPEEQELQQMEGFGKCCCGVPWLFWIQERVGTPVTVALEPTWIPEPGMLQGTGHAEIWNDAESS